MRQSGYRRKAFFLAGSVIVVALIAMSVTRPVSVLSVEGDHSVTAIYEVRPGETVRLEYIHSLYHVLQKEIYHAEGSRLVLESMFFEDYIAASYYDHFSVHPLEKVNGGYMIRGLNADCPLIRFALGHGTQYLLTIGPDKRVDLEALFGSSSLLTIKIIKMSRAGFLIRRVADGRAQFRK